MSCLWIQANERLIHNHKLWFVNPCGNDCKLLLHTVGIGSHRLCQILSYLKHICILVNALLSLCRRHLEYVRDEIQILNTGHVIIQIRVIRNVGKFLFAAQWILLNGYSINIDLPLIKLHNAHNRL